MWHALRGNGANISRFVGGPRALLNRQARHRIACIMPLTLAEIEHIARLAHLALDEAERTQTLQQLNEFFGLIEAIRAVDTQGVEPLAHPLAAIRDVQLRLRADAVTEADQRAAIQQSAPEVQDGLYLVPRVIE